MTENGAIRLATRGSDLARTQAASVQDALERRRRSVELVTVETTGDRIRDELLHRLGKTGAFVRALDERVLDGEADAAVHSMKDVPTESPEDLVVAAVPERAPAGDVLVTPHGTAFEDLPEGATVGTSSLRRGAQLQRERPDLEIEPLRGNVDTRVVKLIAPTVQAELDRRREQAAEDRGSDETSAAASGGGVADPAGIRADSATGSDAGADGPDAGDAGGVDGAGAATDAAPSGDGGATGDRYPEVAEWLESLPPLEQRALEREVETEYDAIVLAEAGLERVGLLREFETQRLPRDEFVPAPGQGALAVTATRGHEVVDALRTALDHRPTRVTTTAERIVLAELGGGCVAPLGVHARLQGSNVHVQVQALSRDGSECVEASRDLPAENYADAARAFARDVADRGAADLIERAKRDAGADTDAADDGAASVPADEAEGAE